MKLPELSAAVIVTQHANETVKRRVNSLLDRDVRRSRKFYVSDEQFTTL